MSQRGLSMGDGCDALAAAHWRVRGLCADRADGDASPPPTPLHRVVMLTASLRGTWCATVGQRERGRMTAGKRREGSEGAGGWLAVVLLFLSFCLVGRPVAKGQLLENKQ